MRTITPLLLLLASVSLAQEIQLPDGAGRAETEKLCKNCHDLARSVSRRQDRDGWQTTINKMIAFGTKGSDQEFAAVADYLAKHYPAGEVPPVNLNTCAAIEIESRLALRKSQANAIIAWREKNGKFKSLADLKKIPALDFAKLEAKQDRIVF